MEENRNTYTAEAAEAAIDSIRKLLDAVGNDEKLKQKLEETLAALTGKRSEAEEKEEEPKEEEESSAAAEEEKAEEDDAEEVDAEEEDDSKDIVSSTDLSDIFTEDAIAGMVVGFVAGATVVGGGVLLHKLIAND